MSFENEIEFTAYIDKKQKKYSDNVFAYAKNRHAIKSAVIFGENTGGKTNFIKSLEFLKNFILGKIDREFYKNLTYLKNGEKQEFYLKCLISDTIFIYELVISENGIENEMYSLADLTETDKLNFETYSEKEESEVNSKDTNETFQKIVELANQTIKNDKKISKEKIESNEKFSFESPKFKELFESAVEVNRNFKAIPEKVSVLYNKINDAEKMYVDMLIDAMEKEKNRINLEFAEISIEVFHTWLRDKLIIELNEQTDKWINNIEKNDELIEILESEEFFEIFKIIDSSITGIEVDKKSPYTYSRIIRNVDDVEFVISIKDDSLGVREFFKIAINLYKVIYKNCVVVADEVDRVLNAIISNKIIRITHAREHKGQFIFTTHNIMNLNTSIFMKSQIYFITREYESLSSKLYSLADFKDYTNKKNYLYEDYIKGTFGGTPNV